MQALINTLVDWFREIYEFLADLWNVFYSFITNPVDLFNSLWIFILEMLHGVVNELIRVLAMLITAVSTLLPNIWPNSMMSLESIPFRWLSAMNWVIPFDQLSAVISVLLVSTVSWITVGVLFRWLKVFQ